MNTFGFLLAVVIALMALSLVLDLVARVVHYLLI